MRNCSALSRSLGFGASGVRVASLLGSNSALTLPSSGRPQAGFAHLRPPLMSNVRRHKPALCKTESIMPINGACHCGSVSFSAEIDPSRVMVCHCTDCQTLSGSPFRAVVAAPIASFELRGEPKSYVKVAQSGNRRAQVSVQSAERLSTPQRRRTPHPSSFALGASNSALNSSLPFKSGSTPRCPGSPS